jgi:glutamate racemase
MPKYAQAPIGIFDSGIGGLTVAHAIKNLLPEEQLIYFGDTAHLPYGDKSAAAVQAYSIKITDLLIRRGCKAIVIACNTASSVAYELLTEYAASRAKIINVVDPMVELVTEENTPRKIGVIGTRGTIASGIYKSKLEAVNESFDVAELATPLLVPMIEEGFIHNRVSEDIIANYLTQPELNNITDLILGCTHYPLIKKDIQTFYSNSVVVHDSSIITANYLKAYLEENGLMREKRRSEKDHFFVSDYTEDFENSANYFFGKNVHLEEYKLWE